MAPGAPQQLVARDVADAKRILNIAAKRGVDPKILSAQRVATKVPPIEFRLEFNGNKLWRAVAKSAVVGCCVLYGNEVTRVHADSALLDAIKNGTPDIANFAGWDFVNPWPATLAQKPHEKTPDAVPSGFEHSLLVTDVGADWVAFVELFGAFRFSVRLGGRTNLPPRGVALNPRANRPARLEVTISAPQNYQRRKTDSHQSEFTITSSAMGHAFQKVLSTWHNESTRRYAESMASKLAERIEQANPHDPDAQSKIVAQWAAEVAALEAGDTWAEQMDLTLLDDEVTR
ncbi:hypothetical protein [Polyangium aurulentum]|uniref:hypothetical protein n=1 Tax=Polyangium aurulentum TaxID=2567896 RepID=UPI001F393159|nr:hypothetical protein [Polyangium aurulentum]